MGHFSFKKMLEIRSSNSTLREGFLLLFVYLIVFKFELYGNNEAVSCSQTIISHASSTKRNLFQVDIRDIFKNNNNKKKVFAHFLLVTAHATQSCIWQCYVMTNGHIACAVLIFYGTNKTSFYNMTMDQVQIYQGAVQCDIYIVPFFQS